MNGLLSLHLLSFVLRRRSWSPWLAVSVYDRLGRRIVVVSLVVILIIRKYLIFRGLIFVSQVSHILVSPDVLTHVFIL